MTLTIQLICKQNLQKMSHIIDSINTYTSHYVRNRRGETTKKNKQVYETLNFFKCI